jgi:hypothetical protein
MGTTIDAVTAAEALGYDWAREDEEAVESVADWIEGAIDRAAWRNPLATGPEAVDDDLPVDADALFRPLLVADPAQTVAELREAAVRGYTRRLVEIWRET